jgi:hypothetical protein
MRANPGAVRRYLVDVVREVKGLDDLHFLRPFSLPVKENIGITRALTSVGGLSPDCTRHNASGEDLQQNFEKTSHQYLPKESLIPVCATVYGSGSLILAHRVLIIWDFSFQKNQ